MRESITPFRRRLWLLMASMITALVIATAIILPDKSVRAAPSVVTFTVNSTLDQVDDNPGDGNCHTASSTCTLRAAVMEANRTSGFGPTIILPAGMYTLTIPAAGLDDDSNGDLNLTTPSSGSPVITIQGAGAGSTIIDGNLLDRVFRVEASRVVTMTGLSIRGGYTGTGIDGGGIFSLGTLALVNAAVSNNTGNEGGGIKSFGTLLLISSTIRGNNAFGKGGGIDNEGTLTMTNSIVNQNNAVYSGGGIYSFGPLTMINSTLNGNVTPFAGGGLANNGPAILTNSTVSGNTAGMGGGGIEALHKLTVMNSTISGNSAKLDGGGIENVSGADGIWLYSATIANNQADADFNGTGIGGGIYNYGTYVTSFVNTILAGNSASGCIGMVCFPVAHDCFGNMASSGSNLIQTLTNDCILYGAGGNQLNVDPMLGPLQDNGGATPTHALQRGSPAIDHGEVNGCRDDQNTLLLTDQRGVNRQLNGRCDIGAYESPALLFLPLILR